MIAGCTRGEAGQLAKTVIKVDEGGDILSKSIIEEEQN
jgi:hypothetical protein